VIPAELLADERMLPLVARIRAANAAIGDWRAKRIPGVDALCDQAAAQLETVGVTFASAPEAGKLDVPQLQAQVEQIMDGFQREAIETEAEAMTPEELSESAEWHQQVAQNVEALSGSVQARELADLHRGIGAIARRRLLLVPERGRDLVRSLLARARQAARGPRARQQRRSSKPPSRDGPDEPPDDPDDPEGRARRGWSP
jgi:hypothetical protein